MTEYIDQFGVIGTAVIAMGRFLVELLRRSDPVAWIAVLHLVVDASSSVSFSSKGIALTKLIALIAIFRTRTGVSPKHEHDPERFFAASLGQFSAQNRPGIR